MHVPEPTPADDVAMAPPQAPLLGHALRRIAGDDGAIR